MESFTGQTMTVICPRGLLTTANFLLALGALLTLSLSCSTYITSAAIMAFHSSPSCLIPEAGEVSQPEAYQPSCSLPLTYQCCSLLIAKSTSSWAFHFLPVPTLTSAALTSWSVDSQNFIASRTFSSLYAKQMERRGVGAWP